MQNVKFLIVRKKIKKIKQLTENCNKIMHSVMLPSYDTNSAAFENKLLLEKTY